MVTLGNLSLEEIKIQFKNGDALFPSNIFKDPNLGGFFDYSLMKPCPEYKIFYHRKDSRVISTFEDKLKVVLSNYPFNMKINEGNIKKFEIDNNFDDLKSRLDKESKNDQAMPVKPFYIIVTKKGSKTDPESPYYILKSMLLDREIQSQFVTSDTLYDYRKFTKFTICNVSLGIAVKMGLRPWISNAKIQLNDESKETIIIGIGITKIFKSRFDRIPTNYVGYISFYNSLGLFVHLKPLYSTIQDLKMKLAKIIKDGISKAAINAKLDVLDVIIHYSGKELSNVEEEMIIKGIREARDESNISKVNLAVLRLIKDSSYRMFSPSMGGYVNVGTYLNLENSLAVISVTGSIGEFFQGGVPRPILMSVKVLKKFKTNSEEPIEINDQIIHRLVHSIVAMTRMNWRTFSAFNFEPATTKYAREMAYLFFKLKPEVSEKQRDILENTLWFI
jgi:hypothetical protein